MRTFLFSIILLSTLTCLGQDVINTAGQTVTNGTHSFDYSIGQIATITVSDTTNFSFTTGFHQPNFYVTAIAEHNKQITVSVFPNPTKELLYIKSTAAKSESYIIKIYDLQGKELINRTLKSAEEQVYIGQLKDGEYIIHLSTTTSNQENQYKIIKITN